jgi:hypothetical protein
LYAVFFHAHQKIDRVARAHLTRLCGDSDTFPPIKSILHFEGRNGPDATKLKNKENVDQPWHFINPFDTDDTELGEAIRHHYDALVQSLRMQNNERASFEAAWLAHALVDGLTPAHHYPYEAKLEDLRGEDRTSRTSLKSRAFVKGQTHRESIKRSLRVIGPTGLLTTHTTFEAGAFMIMQPLKLSRAYPTEEDIANIRTYGVNGYFALMAREVGALQLFDRFLESGWTPKLARTVRRDMAPRMVKMVTLAWYNALLDAGIIKTLNSKHEILNKF